MESAITSDIVQVYESIVCQAGLHPEKAAIYCDDRIFTYGEFRDALLCVRKAMFARNLEKGDRIVIETSTSIDFLIGSISAMSLGIIPVPACIVNNEIDSEIISKVNPTLIIISDGTGVYYSESIKARVITVSTLQEEGQHLEEIQFVPGRIVSEDTAMILYSSGTTSGIRKGVVQPFGALEATARYISDIMKITDEIVEYVASPLDTAFGYGRCRVIFRNGGTLLFNDGMFNPVKMLVMLKKCGGNAIAGDSAIFNILLTGFSKHLKRLGSQIRWLKTASQPLSLENRQRLTELLPNSRLFINYGLTEAMRCCIFPTNSRDDKGETVGRACPGNQIQIVSDDGKVLPAGSEGEVRVSGGNLASGYWNNEVLWKSTFRDGWFYTGDLGVLDNEGFLYIKGRKDDLVNIGGLKISPDVVESKLRPFLPDITFCVLGVPDPSSQFGEILALCVEGESSAINLLELYKQCGGQVERKIIPTVLYKLKKLPKTENGKFQRRVIREKIIAG